MSNNNTVPSMTSRLEDVSATANHTTDAGISALYITCEIIACSILIATIYILLCMVIFGNKSGRWKSSKRKSDVNRGMVYTAAVVAISLTIPRYVANQFIFHATHIPNGLEHCETLLDIGNVCYFTSMTAVYIFLWVRQRALYSHPAMRRLAGKYVNYISWATLIVLTGAGMAVLLWFVIPHDYTHSDSGCIVNLTPANSTADEFSYTMDYIVLLSLLIIAQISLLGLFVYPMIRSNAIQSHSLRRSSRHKNVMMFVAKDGETVVTRKKTNKLLAYIRQVSQKSVSANRKCTIQRTIRRTVICASISMLSDLITMVAAIVVIPSHIPRLLHNIVYDLGIFISVLCIFGTFRGCSKVFLVICKGNSKKKVETTSSGECDTGQYNVKSEESLKEGNSSLK